LAEAEYQTNIQLCKERVVHVPVTKQEVKKAINSLNRNKAADFYGITAENIILFVVDSDSIGFCHFLLFLVFSLLF
jgi:hypothetical protein